MLLQSRSIMASKCIYKSARSRPPIVSPNTLHYGLEVHTIMASMCISSNLLDHGLQVYLHTHSITASNFAPSWPPSESPNSLDYGLHVHLQTRWITTCRCIFKLAGSRPPGAFPKSLDHGLQLYLQTRFITAYKCARSWPLSSYLQTHPIKASRCIS